MINSKWKKRLIIWFFYWRPERTVRMFHVTPYYIHVVRQMEKRLAFVPSVFRTAPPEAVSRSALFVVRVIHVNQSLFTARRHKNVH